VRSSSTRRGHGWSAVSSANRARAEAVFSREATRIAGHRAQVRCDTSGKYVGFVQDADGLAFVGGDLAYLTPGICDTLYQLAFKHRVQSFPRTARAIAVLGHESQHLRGVANEGLANCYGFQSGVQIGVDLGLSRSTAHAMMHEQLATNAQDSSDPRYLVPTGCSDGGPYDLQPGTTGFPYRGLTAGAARTGTRAGERADGGAPAPEPASRRPRLASS
jgi:hypothetical protein